MLCYAFAHYAVNLAHNQEAKPACLTNLNSVNQAHFIWNSFAKPLSWMPLNEEHAHFVELTFFFRIMTDFICNERISIGFVNRFVFFNISMSWNVLEDCLLNWRNGEGLQIKWLINRTETHIQIDSRTNCADRFEPWPTGFRFFYRLLVFDHITASIWMCMLCVSFFFFFVKSLFFFTLTT